MIIKVTSFLKIRMISCVFIKGKEELQRSRLTARGREESLQTEQHHASLLLSCRRTAGSQQRALWRSEPGLDSGCWSLGGTASQSSCLCPHSGALRSEAGCSQTTGWCTDCKERKTDFFFLFRRVAWMWAWQMWFIID